MFLFFVVPLIFAFQELVNQAKFLENNVNGTTYVQLVSDGAFHPIVSFVGGFTVKPLVPALKTHIRGTKVKAVKILVFAL